MRVEIDPQFPRSNPTALLDCLVETTPLLEPSKLQMKPYEEDAKSVYYYYILI